MKKTIFIILFAVVTFTVAAQDTVDLHDLYKNTNYFVYDTIDDTVLFPATYAGPIEGGGEGGKYFFVDKDSLTIYGIAAAVNVLGENSHSPELFNYDTTDSHFYEYLRMYEPEPDSLRWVRQTKVQPYHTPVAYYVTFTRYPHTPYFIPMYECYFDSITVTDSFYVGMTFWSQFPFQDSNGNTMYNRGFIGLYCVNSLNYAYAGYNEPWFICFYNTGGWYVSGQRQWLRKKQVDYSFIYPILTPPDTTALGSGTTFLGGDSVVVTDTVIVGDDTLVVYDTVYIGDIVVGSDTVAMGDTIVVTDTLVIGGDTIVVTDTVLSIMSPDLLQRLTGVTPNPARGTARVVASMGLTMVEAYSMAGRKVHTQRVPQGTLAVTLDVSRWPAGTYLLRIHTPLGATIKKLTVTR